LIIFNNFTAPCCSHGTVLLRVDSNSLSRALVSGGNISSARGTAFVTSRKVSHINPDRLQTPTKDLLIFRATTAMDRNRISSRSSFGKVSPGKHANTHFKRITTSSRRSFSKRSRPLATIKHASFYGSLDFPCAAG
jgi:hypothetical protein